jgi:hypothetical protein
MRKTLVVTATIVTILVLVGIILFVTKNQKQIIPRDIAKKVSFTVYGPDQTGKTGQYWKITSSKISFAADTGVVTLPIAKADTQIILTEQSTPDSFADLPQQYARMLGLLNQYAELQTPFATITLTKPKELGGAQSAVANKGGTLMFAKPSRDLSEIEWKEFFSTFIILHN